MSRGHARYYQMLPSTLAYAEALAQFMTHVGWTRMAFAFNENQNSYHFEMSEQVIRTLTDKGFGPFVTVRLTDVNREHSLINAIRLIKTSGIKVVYVLLPPLETTLLICHAYKHGLRWPEYGWIVPDISLEDLPSLNTTSSCDQNAVQGIISFQKTNGGSSSSALAARSYSDSVLPRSKSTEVADSLKPNIYANALHDSIQATIFALNQTFPAVQEYLATQMSDSYTQYSNFINQKRVSQIISQALANISFPGNLGAISFNTEHKTETQIAICQTINRTYQSIALYNPRENTTYFENNCTSYIPSENLSRVYTLLPLPVEAVLMSVLVACALLTLLNMTLYIIYRKTPEMKASSVAISMIVYLGCYVIYIGCGIDILENGIQMRVVEHDAVCMVVVWTIYPCSDIILATLLVKVCRIYHIFNHFGKISKFCLDRNLLILIVFIVLGKLVILSLWTALDRFRIIDIETYHPESKPPYYEVSQQCYSHYSVVWITITLAYTGTIGSILAFVSFKTRKIKRNNFKDTKKINAVIFTCFMAVATVTPLWWILRMTGNITMSKVIVALLYLLIPMSCQVYLFCPKTMPPLKRSVCKYVFKQDHHEQSNTQERIRFLKRDPLPSQSTFTTCTSLDSV